MDTQQQKSLKVLLIGDSCQDIFVYGRCERLNPEAPVPILNYKSIITKHGMALNVKANLCAFGIEVHMLTNEETLIKTRYIDEKSNQQILRVDNEMKLKPMSGELPKDSYDAVVISDYDKGFITSEFLFDIVNKSTCPIFIDSKKVYLPKNNCYIKINDTEYSRLEGKEEHNNLIITRGGNGAEYKEKLYPAQKVKVYNVVGAGDTFLSALVFGYLKTGKIENAIPLANKASAIAVSNPGTYVLTEEDVNGICN
jgi:D-beta-D-heptose 7-phosphate kinase/D-beta-D-heptose 1-phosphate adenosyltransferase